MGPTLLAVVSLAVSAPADAVLLDFSADWCVHCRESEPVVDALIDEGYAIQRVDFDERRDLAERYGVESVPCFVLVVDGEEVDRRDGRVTRSELKAMFARVKSTPRKPTRSSSDARSHDHGEAAVEIPGVALEEPFSANVDAEGAKATEGSNDLASRALAASVRLKIDDPDGHSYGSGTIIDLRDGEALVLTCGHLFRDSKGRGRIAVDLFGKRAAKGLKGKLISYDLERDVALVSFRPESSVPVLRVARAGHRVRKGETVVSVGCDNGRPPTVRASRVTGLNKFLGPSNIQVAGQPVTGRSGGGLFSETGTVIGVCNAADPSDNEGLFAGVESIHAILNKAGLSDVYLEGDSGEKDRLADAYVPDMPRKMPDSTESKAPPERRRAGSTEEEDASLVATALSREEKALMAEIRDSASTAEVICIIRSLDNPRAKSEIIVLDRASPNFLKLLATEEGQQPREHLTSHDVTARPPKREPRQKEASQSPGAKEQSPRPRSTWRPAWRRPATRARD